VIDFVSLIQFAVKRAQVGQSDGRQPVRIALTALRDLDYLLGQDFLYDRRLAFGVKGPTGNVIGLAQSPSRLGVALKIGTIKDTAPLLTLHTKRYGL
jgi:hypothetical protein